MPFTQKPSRTLTTSRLISGRTAPAPRSVWWTKSIGRFEGLVSFPEQGFRRPNLTNRPLRFIVVRDYPIAYAPARKPLWVVAVMHGKRSPRTMAAILRGREK